MYLERIEYICNINHIILTMRKLTYLMLFMLVASTFAACRDSETYAEKKERETSCINQYLTANGVKVISEETFFAQDSMTNAAQNEWVLFNSTGVYMQIVRKGTGEKLQKGVTTTLLCRFTERNMLGDSIQLTNDVPYYGARPEKMSVKNTSGTFTASFISGASLMAQTYKSTSVPKGWLVPLSYIRLGRLKNLGDEIAKVRLIVPSAYGQANASLYVYPCLYDITFEQERQS